VMDASQEHSRFRCAESFERTGDLHLCSTATISLRRIAHEVLEGGYELVLKFRQLKISSQLGSLGHHQI